jgi:ABC-type branched-subunit amino acid transport system substrate-binding protein
MLRKSARRRLALALAAVTVVAGACSSKTDDQESAATDAAPSTGGGTSAPVDGVASTAGGAPADLETGPGVTADTITLGVLTDQSGPFAGASLGIAQGRQLFWDARNADGGVCGRAVEFDVKDHAYNAQNATSLYAAMAPEVLAFDELLGSPMIAALVPTIGQDGVLTMAVSFSSSLLDNPYVVVTGATYDIEMINAVQWLVDNGQVAEGDTVGHVYLEGDYGENALAGARYAAERLGVTIAEQKVQPTDEDLTAQVTALDQAGAKVVLLTTTPPQAASAVAIAQANGLDMSFVGSNPTFSPALLASPAAAALQESYLMVSSIAPYASDAAGPTSVRDAFGASFADQTPTHFVLYGYAQGELMAQILETACANGTLTRDGLLAAFQSLSDVDTAGLVAPMDFSSPGQPSAREVLILKPDATVEGGLTVVEDLFASPLAADFQRRA